MTPEEFKKTYEDKGWDAKSLAFRWGFKNHSRIYQITRNPNKNPYYIDAVNGLPYIIKG